MRRLSPLVAVLVLLLVGSADAAGPVGLSGTLTGVVRDEPASPDVPVTHDVNGSGQTNLGPTTVTGSVTGTGFVQFGECYGSLRLRSARGTLTLHVSSARIGGFTDCPTLLRWRIAASSGALAGSLGTGTLHLTRTHGRFRLVFDGPGTAFGRLPTTGATQTDALVGTALLAAAVATARIRASGIVAASTFR